MDTLECSAVSFGPDGYIGVNDELELGCKEIVKWFAKRGIDVSSEGPVDGLYGMLSWILHRQQIRDPFQVIMMHGKVYGGGKPLQPVNEVLAAHRSEFTGGEEACQRHWPGFGADGSSVMIWLGEETCAAAVAGE